MLVVTPDTRHFINITIIGLVFVENLNPTATNENKMFSN